MWRLLYAIPSYVVMGIIKTIMNAIGWIIIPPAAYFYKTTSTFMKSRTNAAKPKIRVWKWAWMYPWSNDEDGIEAGYQYKNTGSIPKQIIYWSANRNPSNNTRFMRGFNCMIDEKTVDFKGSFGSKTELLLLSKIFNAPDVTLKKIRDYDRKDLEFWSFVWDGFYSNFRWQVRIKNSMYQLWVGWKIYPEDIYGTYKTGYRQHGAGFTLRPFRKCHTF